MIITLVHSLFLAIFLKIRFLTLLSIWLIMTHRIKHEPSVLPWYWNYLLKPSRLITVHVIENKDTHLGLETWLSSENDRLLFQCQFQCQCQYCGSEPSATPFQKIWHSCLGSVVTTHSFFFHRHTCRQDTAQYK